MSLSYKFDKLNDGDPQKKVDPGKAETPKDILHFDTAAHVRNLCLITLDGTKVFLNYAYLMSGEFAPHENTIRLSFTTHTVTLHGVNLEGLFGEFINHAISQVTCLDKRYMAAKEEGEVFVSDMSIKEESR